MDAWSRLREEFDVLERWIYLDHAAVSPLPRRARRALADYADELGRNGHAGGYMDLLLGGLERARRLGAALMNARPDQVFMARSTTQALGIAVTGLPFRAGDNVVLVEQEFPANVRPWLPLRRRGVDVRLVPQRDGRVDLDGLAAAVDARTACVSVSFVQFLSGFRVDLGAVAELCRRHDAFLVVDAIQGLGVFPVDVARDGVDVLAADSHKWLLGPEGAGLGYVSDRALERIEPALEGWLGVERPFDFFDLEQPLKPTAARFEEGAYNVGGIAAMVGSLELLHGLGVEAVAARLIGLTDHLVEGARRRGWEVRSPRARDAEKSGIVSIVHPRHPPLQTARRLKAAGVVVATRGEGLRISPHAYNTREDLDRTIEALPA